MSKGLNKIMAAIFFDTLIHAFPAFNGHTQFYTFFSVDHRVTVGSSIISVLL